MIEENENQEIEVNEGEVEEKKASGKCGNRGKANKSRSLSYTAEKKQTDAREYSPGTYREIEGGLTIVDV